MTSHDVVAQVRRLSGQRHIGHAGTLDPLAEGVLVLACGDATRTVEYLSDADKAYCAWIEFGRTTTTYDAEGETVAVCDRIPAREEIEAVLPRFRGTITQRPPVYSAIQVGGRRLYALARAGAQIEAPPRQVQIMRLELTDWQPPVATLFVECSKGTYIRALAHDLGQALGCGAYLKRLVRLRTGPFTLDEAVTLEELSRRFVDGTWPEIIYAVDTAVLDRPAAIFSEAHARRLAQGQLVRVAMATPAPGPVRAYDVRGRFVALIEWQPRAGAWKPLKVMAHAYSARG
jgi:tRNA pseudouridine55 synthase